MSASSIIDALGGAVKPGKCKCPICGGKLAVKDAGHKVLLKCWGTCPDTEAVRAQLREMGLWGNGKAPSLPPAAPDHAKMNFRTVLKAKADSNAAPYLAARGIELAPDCLHIISRATSRKLGLRYNTAHMVAPIVDVEGERVGAQVTALSPDMTKRLDRADARRTYGKLGGHFVQLDDFDVTKPLIIGEGVESALAAAQIANLPAIAAIGAENLQKIIPLPPCSEVIIAADSDEPGRKAAEAYARKLTLRGGVKVRIAFPPEGKDWNDTLAAGGNLKEVRQNLLAALAGASFDERNRTVKELAKLSRLDYEEVRTESAAALKCRAAVLDKIVEEAREAEKEEDVSSFMAPVEPWDEPVDGSALLGDLREVFTRHIVMTKGANLTCALWTLCPRP